MQKYSVSKTDSWEELGEAGEQKVLPAVPEGFFYFRNVLVPCHHGNDYEEIDLVVVGATGIWSIEIKNWRGIAYPGDYAEELVFIRNTPSGHRTSYRDNPFYQARNHAQDLYSYLVDNLKEWFPSIHTLVVFASRDPHGVTGVNLDRVRYSNPSVIYLEEMKSVLKDPRKIVRVWDGRHQVKDALSKLRTWDVIHFKDGKRKRGLICRWPGFDRFNISCGSQTVSIDLGSISRIEVMHNDQPQICVRFVFRSGETQIGELLDDSIPVQFSDGRIERVKLIEITEIRTGFSPP